MNRLMRCRDSRLSSSNSSRDRTVSNSRVDNQDSRDSHRARVHHRVVHRLVDSSLAVVSREETLRAVSRETILSSRITALMKIKLQSLTTSQKMVKAETTAKMDRTAISRVSQETMEINRDRMVRTETVKIRMATARTVTKTRMKLVKAESQK